MSVLLLPAPIDDCVMGAALKRQGPIRLSLTHRFRSIRPYSGWREIGAMVSRSAYAQLGYSPWALLGTIVGLNFVFLDPPLSA